MKNENILHFNEKCFDPNCMKLSVKMATYIKTNILKFKTNIFNIQRDVNVYSNFFNVYGKKKKLFNHLIHKLQLKYS